MDRLPSSRRKRTEYIWIDTHLCSACWACVEACKKGVLGKVDLFFHRHVRIDHPELCKGCLRCVAVCEQAVIHPQAIETANETIQQC